MMSPIAHIQYTYTSTQKAQTIFFGWNQNLNCFCQFLPIKGLPLPTSYLFYTDSIFLPKYIFMYIDIMNVTAA